MTPSFSNSRGGGELPKVIAHLLAPVRLLLLAIVAKLVTCQIVAACCAPIAATFFCCQVMNLTQQQENQAQNVHHASVGCLLLERVVCLERLD